MARTSWSLVETQHVQNYNANAQGEEITLAAATQAHDALYCFVIGMRSFQPFNLWHSGDAPLNGADTGLQSHTPAPTSVYTTNAGATAAMTAGPTLVLSSADYTAVTGDFTKESAWNMDGHYPNIYVFYLDAPAGITKVKVGSTFKGDTSGGAWSLGRPVFNGGVNVVVCNFRADEAAVLTADTAPTTGTSVADPATLANVTTGANVALLTAVGIQKNGNSWAAGKTKVGGTAMSTAYADMVVGSINCHFMIEWGAAGNAGAYAPNFSNPLGYEIAMAVHSIR